MKILLIGDIVGSPGRAAFARIAGAWKRDGKADVIVANAENAAAGSGLTPKLAEELFAAGADVLTLGDHAFDQKDLLPYLTAEKRILRPANYPPRAPGHGFLTIQSPAGALTVINLCGRVFMPAHFDCPFRTADELLLRPDRAPVVIVDIHAEATSEKIALGRHLDGRVSAVVGTHTHVQTADEHILPKGTAYLTDLGMTGPHDSVLGRKVEPVLSRFVTGMYSRFDVAENDVRLEGALIDVVPETGLAKSITRVRENL